MSTPVPLIAAASGASVSPGDVIDKGQLAIVMTDVLNGATRNDPPRGRASAPAARWADRYPSERRLSADDPWLNRQRVDAVCSPEALVASGGIALPVNVAYDVPTWASADRPLRDSLPSFQADRGGLRFVTPPDIGVPSLQASPSGLGSATGIWSEATDASPAGSTKPVYSVAVASEQLTYVNAVATRSASATCRAGLRRSRPRRTRSWPSPSPPVRPSWSC